MTNIIESIRTQVRNIIKSAVSAAVAKDELPHAGIDEITVETPKEKAHGEFSTNIAMQLARQVKKAPAQTAAILIANMDYSEQVLARKELVCEMDGALVDHLFIQYEVLSSEARDGYEPKNEEEVKEVVDTIRKSGQDA